MFIQTGQKRRRRILENLLVECCAPTLAGLKTGSLFCVSYASRRALAAQLRALNDMLSPRGLRLVSLRDAHGKALLYLFRPALLLQDLHKPCAAELLCEAGYKEACLEQLLWRLSLRLRSSTDFPHEIGLFLGYPPEDVRGFIENKGHGFKCLGCWKVYGDQVKARQIFAQYARCTSIYRKAVSAGRSLAQLAVNIS